MQQGDQERRAHLHAQFAALGLAVDDACLDALLPAYTGVLSGVRRLASLDLAETEPAMIYSTGRIKDDR